MQSKYPGWRTMTASQRYNAKMERIWADAKALAKMHNRREPDGSAIWEESAGVADVVLATDAEIRACSRLGGEVVQ